MHDAVSLEGRAIPTAVIVTTEFRREADLHGAALGMHDLAPAIIAHPLSTLTDEQIDERAAEALPQVTRIWLGR